MLFPNKPTPQKMDAVKDGLAEEFMVTTAFGVSAYVAMTGVAKEEEQTTPDAQLFELIEGFAESAEGKIVKQKDVLLNGWQGIEAVVNSTDQITGIVRGFVVGRRFYMLTTTWPTKQTQPKDCLTFMDSFKLPKDTAKGPFTVAGPAWRTYTFKDLKISGIFPAAATEATLNLPNDQGTTTMQQVKTVFGNRRYAISESDLHTQPPYEGMDDEKFLKALTNATLTNMDGKVRKQSWLTVGGTKWYRTEVVDAEHQRSSRLDIACHGKDTFLVIADVPTALYPSEEVTKFFGAVKVK